MARPAETYRGARRNAAREPRRCDLLKAACRRRGMTRRELDRERNAVRRFIFEGVVARGFTEGQLLTLTGRVVHGQ